MAAKERRERNRSVILGMTCMTTLPWAGLCRFSRFPPAPGPAERPAIEHRPLIGLLMSRYPAAHTWLAVYAGLHHLDRTAATEVRRACFRPGPWPARESSRMIPVTYLSGMRRARGRLSDRKRRISDHG
jgi:hypothetical protein